jgi:serine/threonine-protein kinase
MTWRIPNAPALLDALRSGALLGPAQLAEAEAVAPRGRRAVARLLLERGWLTPFQLHHVRRGRARALAVGPYLLLDRLGSGGMGAVFRARHRLMRRPAAVKVLRPEALAEAGGEGRFLREAEAAALDHPNIVHAYDAGRHGRALYLAMELVEGPDLSRLVRDRGPLPAALACEYARQAALGLHHAHERGVVHRDLKPSNLLVTEAGAVKVADFGVARLRGAEALTRTGQVLGSVNYIAPEQARGLPADGRADQYGLGCALYFLLSGRPPFAGSPVDRLLGHLRGEPAPLAGVPGRAEAVLRRLMAKAPEGRYPTAAEAAAALAEAA